MYCSLLLNRGCFIIMTLIRATVIRLKASSAPQCKLSILMISSASYVQEMYRVVVWHGSNGTDARAVRSVPVMDTLGHLLIRSGQELTEIPRRSTYSMHPQKLDVADNRVRWRSSAICMIVEADAGDLRSPAM